MPGSPDRTSFTPGRVNVSPSDTQGGSRVPELGPLGSVRGALSNERPYRDLDDSARVEHGTMQAHKFVDSRRLVGEAPSGQCDQISWQNAIEHRETHLTIVEA